MTDNNQRAQAQKTTQARSARVVAGLYEWMEAAVLSLVVIVLLFTFVFRIVGVKGDSMMDTLYNGDRLLMSDILYQPKRGDIVIVARYIEEPLIKRVIAVAGDTLDIEAETGRIILNGVALEESYVHYPNLRYDFKEEILIPDGYVFVMGDHRNNSKDSRDETVGLVRESDIVGRALFRIWPPSAFGGI